ncbi:molecular chaperone Tir [Paramixta manurensis]|uniref:Molecular chaperone Tir n=1 Tax=Paramixta manurensis TaxID=2740817 RepID=A0A6M8UF40_9GAMM|nr:molecular chaperone Tir [Erwiniaceae bacterium PD-1]
MSSREYCQLIDEICRITLLSDPESFYQYAHLNINQINFTLTEQSVGEENNLLIICEMGEIPNKNQAAILFRLLELNFHLFAEPRSPICSVNPETQKVNLCISLPVIAATATGIVRLLTQLAEMAALWRETYFLDNPPRSDSSSYGFSRAHPSLHTLFTQEKS